MGLVPVLWSFGWTHFSEPCSYSGGWWTEGAAAGVGFPSQIKCYGDVQWEVFSRFWESQRKLRWSQQSCFSPSRMLIEAGFFLGKRSLLLFPSLAELRNKHFPFVWFWLTKSCLSFKNKPMFVSIIFAVWNPLLNSVRRKRGHWHPLSYSSEAQDSFALRCILRVPHRPTWQLPWTWRQMLPSCLREVFWCPSLLDLLFLRDD